METKLNLDYHLYRQDFVSFMSSLHLGMSDSWLFFQG